jgi:hypothetical protein
MRSFGDASATARALRIPVRCRSAAALLLAAVYWLAAAAPAWTQANAEDLYREAMRREATLRRDIDSREVDAAAESLLAQARTLVQTYEDIAKLFPRNGYSDNALWQSAVLAADTFWEFGDPADKTRALRAFKALAAQFPTSSLVKQVPAQTARLESAAARPPATPQGTALRAIRREVMPDALRITLELDREVPFYDERVEGPPRVLVDLQNARAVKALNDAALNFPDDVVRQIRVRRQDSHTRVVLAIQGAARHSVYPLYNPYRIVLDFERIVPPSAPAPVPGRPSRNATGGFSLSRQLGLGVARIVIDPEAQLP